MAKETSDERLRMAFENHLKETEGQVERLEKVFSMIDKAPRGVKCPVILGLVEEAKEIMEKTEDDSALNAGLLAGAQAVEHYEMARYGTLIAWAEQLGLSQAIPLLEETLEQEKKVDKLLTNLAEKNINKKAA